MPTFTRIVIHFDFQWRCMKCLCTKLNQSRTRIVKVMVQTFTASLLKQLFISHLFPWMCARFTTNHHIDVSQSKFKPCNRKSQGIKLQESLRRCGYLHLLEKEKTRKVRGTPAFLEMINRRLENVCTNVRCNPSNKCFSV